MLQYVEPSMQRWDETDWIIDDIFLIVSLGLVCQYFIDFVCINDH